VEGGRGRAGGARAGVEWEGMCRIVLLLECVLLR
jgi:hypothetical protein